MNIYNWIFCVLYLSLLLFGVRTLHDLFNMHMRKVSAFWFFGTLILAFICMIYFFYLVSIDKV